MWAEDADESPRGRLFLDAAVLARAEGLHPESLAPPPARGGPAPWRLRRALERMDAHVRVGGGEGGEGFDVSLDAVAEAAGLSPSHFARAFKAETGTTPWRWLLQRRVERAKDLLERTDLSLAEVARLCGFADQSHMGTWFRRLAGATPGRWREDRRR